MSIANNEPPQEEVLVDRPDTVDSIVRVAGPFAVEATIPSPIDLDSPESRPRASAGLCGEKTSVRPLEPIIAGLPVRRRTWRLSTRVVVPAQAGTHADARTKLAVSLRVNAVWVPAFAGTTTLDGHFEFPRTALRASGDPPSGAEVDSRLRGNDSERDDGHAAYLERMLEILRKSPALQVGGGKAVTLRNIRPPAKSLALSAEAVVDANGNGKRGALQAAAR